jgi:hypothetical protein
MRDRHVRRIFLGLIVVFPVLVTALSPAPRPADALRSLAAVEAILITGLFGANRARRGLLADRALLVDAPRPSLANAHFARRPPGSRGERAVGGGEFKTTAR